MPRERSNRSMPVENRLSMIPAPQKHRSHFLFSESTRSAIPLIPGQVVGRIVLMEAFWKACDRGECKECSALYSWARVAISRSLLQVDSYRKVSLQNPANVKGSLELNGEPVDTTKLSLKQGDLLRFLPPESASPEAQPLAFRIVKGAFQKNKYINALECMEGSGLTPPPSQASIMTGLYSQPNSPARSELSKLRSKLEREPTLEKMPSLPEDSHEAKPPKQKSPRLSAVDSSQMSGKLSETPLQSAKKKTPSPTRNLLGPKSSRKKRKAPVTDDNHGVINLCDESPPNQELSRRVGTEVAETSVENLLFPPSPVLPEDFHEAKPPKQKAPRLSAMDSSQLSGKLSKTPLQSAKKKTPSPTRNLVEPKSRKKKRKAPVTDDNQSVIKLFDDSPPNQVAETSVDNLLFPPSPTIRPCQDDKSQTSALSEITDNSRRRTRRKVSPKPAANDDKSEHSENVPTPPRPRAGANAQHLTAPMDLSKDEQQKCDAPPTTMLEKATRKRNDVPRVATRNAKQGQTTLPGGDGGPKPFLKRDSQPKNAPKRGGKPAVACTPAPANSAGSTDAAQSPSTPEYVLFFVEKGSDMSKDLIYGTKTMEGLRAHVELRGARVLDTFEKGNPPYPTHIVVSDRVKSEKTILQALGFDTTMEMGEFMRAHDIRCVKRKWAAKGKGYSKPPFVPPTMMELKLGLNPGSPPARKEDGYAMSLYRNRRIADHFAELSKLYRKCPLAAADEWKSYTFSVLSGRLRRLDFEIKTEEDIRRLGDVTGFGKTSVCIIEEFLRDGTSSRRRLFDQDPKRRAMKVMMGIWGVGRSKATELVDKGYKHIGNVRKNVTDGLLKLERNQYIGLKCYEDILGEMTRAEVESIADVIKTSVVSHYPDAEVKILGSYSRGKQGCGDVDVLITDPSYPATLPKNALAEILDDLTREGHIAYHLTKSPGVRLFETLCKGEMKFLSTTMARSYSRASGKFGCSSWMGVFKSAFGGKDKMRRVDIKFYPHHNRVYASLYFTGNGHFNRSLRLWAKKRFQYKLSDAGLFDTTASEWILKNPSSEKEVFAALQLKWKKPHERDCFDAVESVDGERVPEVKNKRDFEELSQDLEWIE